MRGRLDRPGDHRAARGVGGELAQQRVLRPAADDVDDLDRPARQAGGVVDGAGVRRGEAVEDAAHERGRPAGAAGRPRRRHAAIRAGMSPGARNDGSSGSNTGPPARQRGGGLEQRLERLRRARPLPRPQRLLEQPQAGDVAEEPDRAVDPALVGEVRAPARLGEDRRGRLDADERPRPARDVGERVGRRPARRRPPTRCHASRRA